MAQVARSGSPVPWHVGHGRPTEAFRTVEEAWFWTMAALLARREGARFVAQAGRITRPCEPDDVVRCLDALYRAGRLDLTQARVLRVWGERGVAPDGRHRGERAEAAVWQAALARLAWPLRMKGIIF